MYQRIEALKTSNLKIILWFCKTFCKSAEKSFWMHWTYNNAFKPWAVPRFAGRRANKRRNNNLILALSRGVASATPRCSWNNRLSINFHRNWNWSAISFMTAYASLFLACCCNLFIAPSLQKFISPTTLYITVPNANKSRDVSIFWPSQNSGGKFGQPKTKSRFWSKKNLNFGAKM